MLPFGIFLIEHENGYLSRFSKASWRLRYKVIYDTIGIALLQALDYQIICLKCANACEIWVISDIRAKSKAGRFLRYSLDSRCSKYERAQTALKLDRVLTKYSQQQPLVVTLLMKGEF